MSFIILGGISWCCKLRQQAGLHFEVSDLKRQVAYNGTVQFSDDFCSSYSFLEVDLHHHKISSWLMSLYLKVLRYKVCLYIFQVVCRWHTHKHESRQFCPYSGLWKHCLWECVFLMSSEIVSRWNPGKTYLILWALGRFGCLCQIGENSKKKGEFAFYFSIGFCSIHGHVCCNTTPFQNNVECGRCLSANIYLENVTFQQTEGFDCKAQGSKICIGS